MSPTFTNFSEQLVYERLTTQLPDAVVLANLRLADGAKDHELDLVVLVPGAGVVVVEVKGGSVWREGERWLIRRGRETQRIHPVDQARDGCYALRGYVEADPRWARRRVRFGHHVVLAQTPLAADFATPDCPRWAISGQGDLDRLGQRIVDTVAVHRDDRAPGRPPDADDVRLIAEILVGRSLPQRDIVREARVREDAAQRLTQEQATLLQVTRLLNRVEIRGGAGSGKTVLATTQARQLAGGHGGRPRLRVAVLCYSYGLAAMFRRQLLVGSQGKRPAFVGSFEDLGRRWGLDITAGRDDHDFWERRLPALMAGRAAALPEPERFDAVIIDEAQDFADTWWRPLLLALRDEESGGFYAYSDERQRVFARFGQPPVPLVPLVLDHNLRNTRQIAQSFLPLAPTGMSMRGGDGPEVTFVACATPDALGVADDQVEVLLDEGWRAEDIALITLGSRHPVQVERQETLGARGYWDTFWDNDDIFYGHVLGFKGMERRAVIVCLNEDGRRDRAAERLYVGLSRATDRMIVVGDPDVVRRVGGERVLRELGFRG